MGGPGVRAARLIATLVMLAACSPGSGVDRGVVISVEGDLDEVVAFTLLVEGEQIRFEPDPAGDFEFPLAHLRDHVRNGEPVLVGWELVGSVRRAVTIADG